MKLLIVEDELELLSALKKGFIKKGFAVDTAKDGNEASYLAEVNDYDVIILDLNLPYKDGIEVLKEIREKSFSQKVIILSARASVPDKILGLDMGANDYVAKPFDFLELEARVRNLSLRDFAQKNTIIKIGNLFVDTAKKVALFEDKVIEFAPKEYAILEYLFINAGITISAQELIEHIWASEVDLFSVSVKVHISNIRKKLSLYTQDEILKTVRGTGYLIEKECLNEK